MPPAKFLSALAKDDVRLIVLFIPVDIVAVIVSARAVAGRGTVGDEERVREVGGEEVREDRRDRAPASARWGGGSL